MGQNYPLFYCVLCLDDLHLSLLMRKKFNSGSKPIKKITLSPEMLEAKKQFKKLVDSYKNKPIDDAAVKKGFRIFTK